MDEVNSYGTWLNVRVFFHYVVYEFQPIPQSDYRGYWDVAQNLSQYIKGGPIVLLYRIPRLMEINPAVAALYINSIFWIFMIEKTFVISPDTKSRLSFFAQGLITICLIPFGLLFGGYIGIVNCEVPNIALLVISIRYLYEYFRKNDKKLLLYFTLFLGLSISFRLKTALVLVIFGVLLLMFAVIVLRKKLIVHLKSYSMVLIAIMVSVIIGFSFDSALRLQSDVEQNIQGRAQLYIGFLMTTPEDGSWIGGYKHEYAVKAGEELDIPLFQVIYKYMSQKTLGEVVEITKMKMARVAQFNAFSYAELGYFGIPEAYQKNLELPSVLTDPITRGDVFISKRGVLQILNGYEKYNVQLLKVVSVILLIGQLIIGIYLKKINKKKEAFLVLAPISVYLAYYLIHIPFEIQARYMWESYVASSFLILLVFITSFESIADSKDKIEINSEN